MTRLLAISLLATAWLASLSIVACGGRAEAEKIGAAAGGAIEMGIDPQTTGNTASTLGTLEPCVRVDVPSPAFDGVSDYNIDVYVKGDTQAPMAYDASVVYAAVNDGCAALDEPETGAQCLNSADDDGDTETNDGCPQVGATAESGEQCAGDKDDDGDIIVHVAAPGTNTQTKMPGALSLADTLPDSDGIFAANAVYLTGGPGTAGDGTLARLGLDIGGSGLVTFALNPPSDSAYASGVSAHNLAFVSAQLAINQDCPGVTPTPTPGTPTATSTATPLPTPPPGTIMLVNGWNNPCYVGPEQPIEDALADVVDHVLAVYRMTADQRFEGWFPNRPKASDITTVRPYQPLFILMDQYAFWPHEPSGTPPPSVPLASGWNNVCYPGQTKSAEDATAGVAGGFVIMYQLGSDQGWSWYAPARSGMSSIAQLSQYDTVLVLVNQEGGTTWTFDSIGGTPTPGRTPTPGVTPTPTHSPTPTPTAVIVFTGQADKDTSSFHVSGSSFTIGWNTQSDSPEYAGFSIYVYPEGETALYACSADFDGVGSDSTVCHAGPGDFWIAVLTANLGSWRVDVSD